jgi:hypothetical protein
MFSNRRRSRSSGGTTTRPQWGPTAISRTPTRSSSATSASAFARGSRGTAASGSARAARSTILAGYGRDSFITDGANPIAKSRERDRPARARSRARTSCSMASAIRGSGRSTAPASSATQALRDFAGHSLGWWDLIWTDRTRGRRVPGEDERDLVWMTVDWDLEQVIVGIPWCSRRGLRLRHRHGAREVPHADGRLHAAGVRGRAVHGRRLRAARGAVQRGKFMGTATAGQATVKRYGYQRRPTPRRPCPPCSRRDVRRVCAVRAERRRRLSQGVPDAGVGVGGGAALGLHAHAERRSANSSRASAHDRGRAPVGPATAISGSTRRARTRISGTRGAARSSRPRMTMCSSAGVRRRPRGSSCPARARKARARRCRSRSRRRAARGSSCRWRPRAPPGAGSSRGLAIGPSS